MGYAKRLPGGKAALAALAAALLIALAALGLTPGKAYAYGITQTAATANSATISWEDPNAGRSSATTTGYTVSWGAEYGNLPNTVKLAPGQRSYTIAGLAAGTEYYAKVEYTYTTSYSLESKESVVGSGDVKSRVVTPTGVKQTKWWYYAGSVDFAWNVQTAADKVEYKVCKAGSKKVFAKGGGNYPSKSCMVSKVKNNTMYTVQMRVHDQWGWSGWSKKTYLFAQPMVNSAKTKVKGNKLTVTWGKIKGATSYDVYVSTKEKKGYKKVASVKSSKSSVTVKKLGKSKFSPKKKYYVYVVAKKKDGKVVSTSGRHYSYQVKGARGQLRWTFD